MTEGLTKYTEYITSTGEHWRARLLDIREKPSHFGFGVTDPSFGHESIDGRAGESD